jgi:hypothetical protein
MGAVVKLVLRTLGEVRAERGDAMELKPLMKLR